MVLVPLMNSLSLTHHSYTRILHEEPLVIAIEEKDEKELPIPHGTLDPSVNYSTQDQRSASIVCGLRDIQEYSQRIFFFCYL